MKMLATFWQQKISKPEFHSSFGLKMCFKTSNLKQKCSASQTV